jgi:hypothetical protein
VPAGQEINCSLFLHDSPALMTRTLPFVALKQMRIAQGAALCVEAACGVATMPAITSARPNANRSCRFIEVLPMAPPAGADWEGEPSYSLIAIDRCRRAHPR